MFAKVDSETLFVLNITISLRPFRPFLFFLFPFFTSFSLSSLSLLCLIFLLFYHDLAGYHGPLDVARHIVKTEGPLRLFNGLGATILRDTPSYGLYFTVYEAIDRQLSDFSAPFRAIVGGGFTGVLTWLSVYPVDVIKSRIQAGQAWSIKELYYSGSLFRGMLPCLVRAFPVNAVTFLFYTSIKRFLTIEFL